MTDQREPSSPEFHMRDVMHDLLVVDTRATVLKEAGEMLLSGAEIYAELGEVLAGAKPVLRGVTTVVKSVGMAVEDIVAARVVFERVRAQLGERSSK